MAIKLYQGADSALASAAYKAAAAKAPADVSGVMQSVAASYDRTLRAQAQMWGNIGKAATQVGLAIHKDINTRPPSGTDYIIGDLDKTQDMMKISYGLKADENGNRLNPFSREAKELRSQARQERSRLFAEAEYELEGLKTITTAHDSGLVDPVMTGLQNMEMSHAAVATSRGKTTDYGNYFKWEDIDGARKWVLYHDPSKIKENAPVIEGLPSSLTNGVKTDKDGRVLNSKGEITATTTAEIAQNLMFDKLDTKGVGIVRGKKRATAFNIQERGFNSSVPYAQLDEYQKNYLQELIDGEKNDRVSWFTPSHADPDMRSFYNRVTNADGKGASQINAEMFVQIGNLTGYEFEKGKGLKKEGALAGLTDTDKDGYISEKEFLQQDNVKLFGASLFGGENYDPELTAALYADDAERNYAAIFDNGFSKRPTDTGDDAQQKTPSNDSSDGYFNYTFVPSANKPGNQLQVDPTSAKKAYDNIENKTKDWSGAQGHYVKMKDKNGIPMYLRYDSRADYLQDLNDNKKLSISKGAWEITFGINPENVWNIERYIPETRVVELEGATIITNSGNKKYD